MLEFANCNMNAQLVAHKLHYMRTTVVYHLASVHKLTGLDPMNFRDLARLVQLIEEGGIDNFREE